MRWWNCSSFFFDETYVGTFGTEDGAVDFLKANAMATKGYTWALLVFDKLVPARAGRAVSMEFTIRMNVSNVPSTRQVINERARGLNSEYKKYYTSGFLSLQQQMEWFAAADHTKSALPRTCVRVVNTFNKSLKTCF